MVTQYLLHTNRRIELLADMWLFPVLVWHFRGGWLSGDPISPPQLASSSFTVRPPSNHGSRDIFSIWERVFFGTGCIFAILCHYLGAVCSSLQVELCPFGACSQGWNCALRQFIPTNRINCALPRTLAGSSRPVPRLRIIAAELGLSAMARSVFCSGESWTLPCWQPRGWTVPCSGEGWTCPAPAG